MPLVEKIVFIPIILTTHRLNGHCTCKSKNCILKIFSEKSQNDPKKMSTIRNCFGANGDAPTVSGRNLQLV